MAASIVAIRIHTQFGNAWDGQLSQKVNRDVNIVSTTPERARCAYNVTFFELQKGDSELHIQFSAQDHQEMQEVSLQTGEMKVNLQHYERKEQSSMGSS